MGKWMRLTWSLFLFVAGRELLSESSEVKKGEKPPVEVKAEGAVLRYVPLEIPRSQRTPRGEIDAIEGAVATLKIENGIAFRRARLPAGEYGVRVAVEDGKSHYLVLEPKAASSSREEKDAATSGAALDSKRNVESANIALEKSGEKDAVKKGAEKEEKQSNGEHQPKNPRGEKSQGRSGERRDGASPPLVIRAPLTLSAAQTETDTLAFDLRVSRKGTRLRVVLRAGSTEARTSALRLGDK